MLSLPPSVRIFVGREPTDMRKSFDGLSALAAQVVGAHPMSGQLFVFFNRSGAHVKILWWDRSGYALFAKRLESGRFRFVDRIDSAAASAELSVTAEDDIRELLRQPEIALARFRELEAKIADQAAIIEELLRRLYGKSSEKRKKQKESEAASGDTPADAVVAANGIRRSGCMAHARRKFEESAKRAEPRSKEMLLLMGRLYWIEAALKKRIASRALEPPAADALILKVRQRRSRVRMSQIDRLRQQLAVDPTTLPKSQLGKAMTYLTNQWSKLEVYLDDPKVAIDNNATERAIRPIAIGRKNWLMAGSPRGAQAAARLYSIINVCKALDIDPYTYLSDVLEKVSPSAPLDQLTPWAWKRATTQATAATTTT